MRKIIAVLLTVLMLASVLAALPVSAAEAKTYDGTTKDTVNKIFISEIAPYMYYHQNGIASLSSKSKSMNFIELYNNGAGDVSLTALSILRAVRIFTEPSNEQDDYVVQTNSAGAPLWREWRDYYKFLTKVDIKDGKIVDDETAALTSSFTDTKPDTPELDDRIFKLLTNEGVDMTFSSGENVVLWMVNSQTVEWMKEMDKEVSQFNPREYFVKSYYGANANAADYTIVMVWAWSDYDLATGKLSTDMFSFDNLPKYNDNNKDYIFGVAQSDWDLESDVAYDIDTKVANDKLYSMTVMGASVPQYIGTQKTDVASVFGVPTLTPYIANAYEAFTAIGTPEVFTDYLDAGYVQSYRETGAIDWACAATPGTMPVWQWAMIDAAACDELKTDGNVDEAKVKAAVDAYIKALKLVDGGEQTGQDESGIDRDYNFQLQEDLKNQFYKQNQGGDDDKGGLSPLVLILIIVAAVVVVGGGAFAVVFFVILPKKKAAAAAAVEAPVEEAAEASEEAPAAEDAPVEEGNAE